MSGAGNPIPAPVLTARDLILRLVGAASVTAGSFLVGNGTSQLVDTGSAVSYLSGVFQVAGSVPGMPSAGQVLIGGGAVRPNVVIGRGNDQSFIQSRNAANNATYDIMYLDGTNRLVLGSATTPIYTSGTITCLAGITCTTLTASGNCALGQTPGTAAWVSVGDNNTGNGSVRLFGGSAQKGWQIGSNITTADALEFSAASAGGGTTFSNTALILSPSAPGTPGATEVRIGGGDISVGGVYRANSAALRSTGSGASIYFDSGTGGTAGNFVFRSSSSYNVVGTLTGAGALSLSAGITATTGDFAGGVRATTSSFAPAANCGIFDYSGGGRFLGLGPNGSTRGTFKIGLAASDATSYIDALAFSNTGAATFASGVTCTTLTTSGGSIYSNGPTGSTIFIQYNGTNQGYILGRNGSVALASDGTKPFDFEISAARVLGLTSGAPGTPGGSEVLVGGGQIKSGAGITAGGLIQTTASATGGAGLNLPHGAAPTSPVDGDIWTTTAGAFARINGATVGLGSGSAAGSNTQLQFNNSGVFGGSANLTWSGSALSVNTADAATNTKPNALVVSHTSSGTPAADFGTRISLSAHSSTNTLREQAFIESGWTTATDASRSGYAHFGVVVTGTSFYHLKIGYSGGATIGFFGSSGTTKPGVTGSRASNAALASLMTALSSLGIVTDSTTA